MPGTHTQRPARRSDAQLRRRDAILDAARVELTKHGYDGVTMEAIATRVGVTRKTLYNQYGSKDELLLAAVSEIIEGYRTLGSDIEPGIPSIVESRQRALRVVAAKPAYADAMVRAVSQAPPEHPLVDLLFRQAVRLVADQLRVAAAQGELVPGVDLDEAAEEISAQGWGTTAYAAKDAIRIDRLERQSMRGLFVLLLSIVKGRRRGTLGRMLDELEAPRESQQEGGSR